VQTAASVPHSKARAAKVIDGSAVGYGNADAIIQEELRIYVQFLASDQLEGAICLPAATIPRHSTSPLGRVGLKPGGSTTRTNGPLQPYFMPMELATRQVVVGESKVSITAPTSPVGEVAAELVSEEAEHALQQQDRLRQRTLSTARIGR
jgi:hypothetical protein